MRLLLAALLCTAPHDAYHHGARGGLSRRPRADALARRRSSALRAFDPREPTRGFGKPGDGAGDSPSVELVWGHVTPSLAVGMYHHRLAAPRAFLSRSPAAAPSVSGAVVRF